MQSEVSKFWPKLKQIPKEISICTDVFNYRTRDLEVTRRYSRSWKLCYTEWRLKLSDQNLVFWYDEYNQLSGTVLLVGWYQITAQKKRYLWCMTSSAYISSRGCRGYSSALSQRTWVRNVVGPEFSDIVLMDVR